MKKQPDLCVVVPVYNAEQTLTACVESVLSQPTPGGLCCVLVDDGSTDGSAALCERFAERDSRVRAVRLPGGGVSAARNAGLRAMPAETDFVVFLDSDDHLLPGALSAALQTQLLFPSDFVVWQYDTGDRERLDCIRPDGRVTPRPQSALARLYMDCLIAMPWNKLYRAELIRQQGLCFNESYSLGEDLQFVLDYVQALNRETSTFRYAVLNQALTFYDCSKSDGTLSTRYLPDYCAIWSAHYERLNAACAAAGAPQEDVLPLHRAELTVLAEGVADILRRDPGSRQERCAKASAALRGVWLRSLLRQMKAEGNYSAYYLPALWRSRRLVYAMAEAKRSGSPLYGKLDWAGYYLLGGRRKRD